jgi:putrescine aminotransferase
MPGKVDDLTQISLAHLMFPLVPKNDLDADGPMILVKGEGVTVTDQYGKTYIDMMSGVTRAASLGYGNKEIGQAMYDQAARMHYSGTGRMTSVPATLLAEKLAAITPGRLSKVSFTSGGSEATETSLKIAKQYLQQSGKKPRAFKVISRWSSYHGATMAALSCTDWLAVREIPDPRVPGHSFVANPMRYRNPLGLDEKTYSDLCVAHLERQIQLEGPELVAAFIGEPFQQANGVQIPLPGYWTRIREICDKYEVILIIDEVITGFGRTGTWFATEQIGIEPDILNVAKAMGGGYAPVGAVITRDEIADGIGHFRHVHTYSGHAVSCAVALKVIEIMERDRLVERSDALAGDWQDDMKATLGITQLSGTFEAAASGRQSTSPQTNPRRRCSRTTQSSRLPGVRVSTGSWSARSERQLSLRRHSFRPKPTFGSVPKLLPRRLTKSPGSAV